ncbi:MAG: hypothetical protein V3U87_13890 [Methylococcaceae bacterium]
MREVSGNVDSGTKPWMAVGRTMQEQLSSMLFEMTEIMKTILIIFISTQLSMAGLIMSLIGFIPVFIAMLKKTSILPIGQAI